MKTFFLDWLGCIVFVVVPVAILTALLEMLCGRL